MRIGPKENSCSFISSDYLQSHMLYPINKCMVTTWPSLSVLNAVIWFYYSRELFADKVFLAWTILGVWIGVGSGLGTAPLRTINLIFSVPVDFLKTSEFFHFDIFHLPRLISPGWFIRSSISYHRTIILWSVRGPLFTVMIPAAYDTYSI